MRRLYAIIIEICQRVFTAVWPRRYMAAFGPAVVREIRSYQHKIDFSFATGGVEKHLCCFVKTMVSSGTVLNLRTLTTNAPGKLDVLRHDGHALSVNCREVRVLEKAHEVGLSGFLEGEHGRSLESKVCFVVLCNLTHKALERQFSDK